MVCLYPDEKDYLKDFLCEIIQEYQDKVYPNSNFVRPPTVIDMFEGFDFIVNEEFLNALRKRNQDEISHFLDHSEDNNKMKLKEKFKHDR